MSRSVRTMYLAACFVALASVARAAAPCGAGAPLIALGTEAVDQVRLGVATTYLSTTVCRNGLVQQARAVRDTRAYAPFFATLRNPRLALDDLNAALSAGHVGTVKSCTVPEQAGRTQDLLVVDWFGANGRQNHFLFRRGASDLFPPCPAAAAALFTALRSFETGVVSADGTEVLNF